MMSDKEKILSKVRKLLSLSEKNTNAHESHAAFMRAQELLVKYNLELGNIVEDDVVEEKSTEYSGRISTWKSLLADVIAENFRCESIIFYSGQRRALGFVGVKTDVDIAKQVFLSAIEFAELHCAYYLSKERLFVLERNLTKSEAKSKSNSWRHGFVSGLREEYAKQVISNGWELVIRTPEKVREHIQRYDVPSRTSYYTSGRDDKAKKDGKAKGHQFGSTKKEIGK